MNPAPQLNRYGTPLRRPSGFSLIELMISIAISLVIMLALIGVFVNITRSNAEMARTNSQIENGRFAMQVLQSDLVNAGFWGGYVPQFDDLSSYGIPAPASAVGGSVPTAAPDPCLAYTTPWNDEYKANLIGIPVQTYTSIPASCALAPSSLANQKPNTDVLVVRHVETCEAGVDGCDDTAGNLYFQYSYCEPDLSGMIAQAGGADTIKLATTASNTINFYTGSTIRILEGPGAGQSRTVTAYDNITKIATVDPAWTTAPSGFSRYVFGVGYVLGTSGHNFTKRNCTTAAARHKFISNIYYIRDFAASAGDGIPTLVRSQFLAGGTLAHQPAQALIEGIDGFKVELGIDNRSDTGIDVINHADPSMRYDAPIKWLNPTILTQPQNRGDGSPDGAFVRSSHDCPTPLAPPGTVLPCTAALTNLAAVKLHLLVRSREATPGYVDNKTYYLDSAQAAAFNPCVDTAGTALSGAALTACQRFKRHVFSTTVRLNNISGRRETPP